MQLYLARHTQATHNISMLLNSDPSVDVSLTEIGIRQAEELANKLANVQFEVIYVSEFPRTEQTAEIINQHRHVPITVDSLLNENVSGFEGKPLQDYLDAFNASSDRWHEAFNGGESLEHARARAGQFLAALKETNHSAVLVITHGYIVEAIYGIISDLSMEEASTFQITQGEYAVFEI